LNDELNQAVPHLADPGRVVAVLDSLHIQHSNFDPGTRRIEGKVRDSSSTLFHHRSTSRGNSGSGRSGTRNRLL
jgi:hypothetical protein